MASKFRNNLSETLYPLGVVELDNIAPENLWYVVGFIATDGNLSPDMRHINITSKDRAHLFAIRKALGLSNTIGRKCNGSSKKKLYSVLQFGDVNFFKFLVEIGLTPKKSLTLGPLKIQDKYFIHFLRGVIDGDGHLISWIHPSNRHKQWALGITSASPKFSYWLKNEIEVRLGVRGKIYSAFRTPQVNPIYKIKFGKLAMKVIISQIYKPAYLSLNRKFRKSLECLHDRNRMINYGGVVARVL